MKSLPVHSITGLILLAFCLAIIPLITALLTATFYLDRITTQGEQAITEAKLRANATQAITETMKAMERSAWQYNILGDEELYRVYLDRREEYFQALSDFRSLGLNAEARQSVAALAHLEADIHAELERAPSGSEAARQVLARFRELADAAWNLEEQSSSLVDKATLQLQDSANSAKNILLWQTAGLLPFIVLITVLLIVNIIRPIHQLDVAIRRLGQGEFDNPVRVHGTRDIESLGLSLEHMRTRILHLENQKVTFLRHISHELKTPLASLREGSELLAENLLGPLNEEQSEVAQLLQDNSQQLQDQIEDLLEFSMTQNSELSLNISNVRLDQEIRKVIDGHQIRIKNKALELAMDLQALTIPGDAEKLRVVVDNIVSNAIRFSPHKGILSVSLKAESERAIIEIADQGPGIPAEEREKVFNAFFQGAVQHREYIKGTGLGLSIAQAYVALHGGKIYIGKPEIGASLSVVLPVSQGASNQEDPG